MLLTRRCVSYETKYEAKYETKETKETKGDKLFYPNSDCYPVIGTVSDISVQQRLLQASSHLPSSNSRFTDTSNVSN